MLNAHASPRPPLRKQGRTMRMPSPAPSGAASRANGGAPQVHECKLPFRLHEIVPNMTHESESFSNLRQRSAEMQHFHRWSPRRKPSPEFDLGSRVANDSSSLPARVGFFKWVTGLLAVSVSRQSSRKYSELCWGWGDSASSALRPHSHC